MPVDKNTIREENPGIISSIFVLYYQENGKLNPSSSDSLEQLNKLAQPVLFLFFTSIFIFHFSFFI